jgi:hypothetical protein
VTAAGVLTASGDGLAVVTGGAASAGTGVTFSEDGLTVAGVAVAAVP